LLVSRYTGQVAPPTISKMGFVRIVEQTPLPQNPSKIIEKASLDQSETDGTSAS